ncbi:MAG: ADP-glyceromanno-heptose 6-epimerase [Bacteroidota bacterium]
MTTPHDHLPQNLPQADPAQPVTVVTGAAGFISSCVVAALNAAGQSNLVLVDDFDRPAKARNFDGREALTCIDRRVFMAWEAQQAEGAIAALIHLGARTDTAEQDWAIFEDLNIGYSQAMWQIAVRRNIPLVYASSAATYGGGELGFADRHDLVADFRPLNPYGRSKNDFDAWALAQEAAPPFWAGLKFFNVYGPNEYHKGRMASVMLHAFRQIRETGKLKLFRSHRADFKDGEQLRDFVYVKDVVKVIEFLLAARPESGIYNLGTGQARTFLDLGRSVFAALELEPKIEFIDTPADIRDAYQYFTQAEMAKLLDAGYTDGFHSLEDGIHDYVRNFLVSGRVF